MFLEVSKLKYPAMARVNFQFVHTHKQFLLLILLLLGLGREKSVTATSMFRQSAYMYESYNEEQSCFPSQTMKYPKSEAEVQSLVLLAISLSTTVKAFGSLHSTTDLICTDGIPINMHGLNSLSYNSTDQTVTVGAGAELIDVLNFLHGYGRALVQFPTFGGITIGGGIGTGVHGSTLTHPSSLSDQVIGVRIVDGTGQFRDITDPQELLAFRLSLGLLGIILTITFPTVPQYKVQIKMYDMSEEVLFQGLTTTLAREADFFQFWWLPGARSVIVADGTYVNVSVTGNAAVDLIPDVSVLQGGLFRIIIELFQALRFQLGLQFLEDYGQKSLQHFVVGKPPLYSEVGTDKPVNPAIGYSHKMMTNKCTQCAWQLGKNSVLEELFDLAVDVQHLPNILREIRAIMDQAPLVFPLISIYFRYGRATDTYMAVENGRDSVHMELTLAMRVDQYNTPKMGLAASQAILQTLFTKYNGRAHWAKTGLYYINRENINQRYPNRPLFVDVMQKYDPNGIFLNDFGRRVLGESDQQTKSPKVIHCALQDYCVCKVNGDCAFEQTCSQFFGFNVCKDIFFDPPINYPSLLPIITRHVKAENGTVALEI